MPRTIVFDVNETLLDLSSLDPLFADELGDASARREWFAMLLRAAFTATITDQYRPFGDLGRDVLRGLAAARGRPLDADGVERIVAAMATLPAHPDVEPALERLRGDGFRLATLTNSAPVVAERQLRAAGIREHFDRVLSVDPVRRFKPAREVYEHAARELSSAPAELTMVAAHDWDLRGAGAAGLRVAYIERPGIGFSPPDERPELSADHLVDLADRIAARGG